MASLFPAHSWLKEVAAESYLAVPLKDRQRQVLGHFGIMDNESELTPPQMSVFQIFAARAGVVPAMEWPESMCRDAKSLDLVAVVARPCRNDASLDGCW